MFWIPLLLTAGVGYYVYDTMVQPNELGCYDTDELCWLDDKAPETCEELIAVRTLAREGSMSYRLDPVKTTASYLNRTFILANYRSRPFLVEKVKTVGSKTRVLISFDDNTHMAFELYRPPIDGTRDIYLVSRYAYVD